MCFEIVYMFNFSEFVEQLIEIDIAFNIICKEYLN